MEDRRLQVLRHENDLCGFNAAQTLIVRHLAEHRPIGESLEEVCDLVERSLAGSQCIVVQRSSGGALDLVTTSEVSDTLLSAVRDRMSEALERHAVGDFESRRFEFPDPEALRTNSVWCLPIYGLGDRPLGGLCVTRDWTNATDRTFGACYHAARLVQLAIEQRQAVDDFAATLAAERQRIANDLHDDPIQSITVVSLMLQRAGRDLPPDLRATVDNARRKADDAIERMRHILFELHPASLDEDGLATAIEVYLEETFDPLQIAWTLDDRCVDEVDQAAATLGFRLVHEALTNVLKHAEASAVAVSLTTVDGGLGLTIVDDGRGFDASMIPPYRPGHLGIANVQYLARRTGGRFEVHSEPGDGCTVDIWIPRTYRSRPTK